MCGVECSYTMASWKLSEQKCCKFDKFGKIGFQTIINLGLGLLILNIYSIEYTARTNFKFSSHGKIKRLPLILGYNGKLQKCLSLEQGILQRNAIRKSPDAAGLFRL